MPIKVKIKKGKGSVKCVMPGFILDEKKTPFIFVEETTEQLERLINRELVEIEEVSEGDVDDICKKLSARFTKRAKDEKLKQLRQEMKTGGIESKKHPDGTTETVIPEGIKPDEVRALAAAEIKAIESEDTSDLDDVLGILGAEGSS